MNVLDRGLVGGGEVDLSEPRGEDKIIVLSEEVA